MTEAEKAALGYLDAHGIPYERAEHERVSAISECVLPERILGALMPRNLFLTPRTKSAYYLLIAHPDSVFRTSSVSRQAGSSRLSFADEEALKELLHTHPGAVSPLGLIFDTQNQVRLLIDRKLLTEPALLFHPLDNTSSVKLTHDGFFTCFLGTLFRGYTPVDMDESLPPAGKDSE